MASLLSRNSNANTLRLLQRCLRSQPLQRSNPFPEPSSPPIHYIISPDIGVMPLEFHQRFLCLSTQAEKLNAEGRRVAGEPNSETKAKGENESAGEGKSEEGSRQDSQQSDGAGKPVRGGIISWLSFLLLAVTGAGLVFYYDKQKKQRIEEISISSKAVKEGPSAGKAAIGGPFSLIDDEGKPVTEKRFIGKWTLIYFGFTHCPDICPDELQKLAAAIDNIKAKAGIEIVPVFISVDPERDTVEQVHEYVKEFHPKLIGLTGSPEEIKKVARAYRVYYMKTAEEDSDYLVDHSIVMYLMGPDMGFVKFFGKNNDVDALTDGIINEIKRYKK